MRLLFVLFAFSFVFEIAMDICAALFCNSLFILIGSSVRHIYYCANDVSL